MGHIAVVIGALAGCGDASMPPDDPSPVAVTDTTATGANVPPSSAPADDIGAFGAPAAGAGEFADPYSVAITATATLDDTGCWYLTAAGSQALLVAPEGTTRAATGTGLVMPDGVEISSGDAVDAAGWFQALVDLPGGPDGRWADYVADCEPGHGDAVVTTSLGPAFDPDTASREPYAAELIDRGAALFETDHGCGYGFATGDRAGVWALHIDVAPRHEPPSAGVVSLPDERFVVTVTAGAHLFANYCDDVAEWFEPEPATVAVWPIIAGGFTYPGADGACLGATEVVLLTGAVVDVDGTAVPLDDITIVNDAFGCFAG